MTAITNLSQLDFSKEYTYTDYLKWQLKESIELIKGKISLMSPAPVRLHQKISMRLSAEMFYFLKQNPCEVYTAPFDVRLTNKDGKQSVVQPDISVICDKSKLDARGCVGAPDIVIEILSPSNHKKEMDAKFDLYQESGVKEYWIVEPRNQTVLMYVLENDKFIGLKPFSEGQQITSTVLTGFSMAVDDVFKE
ncbi:hypothetical protein MOMA_02905 [Moraxella macacae 0408225]|uniref:Putative restriction endonuclease domain-containing protein n=1 Tax=Moraxella macacae 0408225 TaxID=1230338 RepID=L2F8T7_9GAMM|nr:Uma2 family endonuclease [Moraxella macacae]ELA09320.1 hypothetical protein MOMA_02905 [Moraxella macacae 0408225]